MERGSRQEKWRGEETGGESKIQSRFTGESAQLCYGMDSILALAVIMCVLSAPQIASFTDSVRFSGVCYYSYIIIRRRA